MVLLSPVWKSLTCFLFSYINVVLLYEFLGSEGVSLVP